MKPTTTLVLSMVVTAGLALSGCGGSSFNDGGAAPTPPPVTPTDFTTFTQGQFAASATTETALPVEVDAVNFSFLDDDNPAAFNVIIDSAM